MSSLQDTPSTEHPDPAIKSHRDRQDFVRDLTALIPQLRAFARSLCRDPSYADDLAQEALASAWKARATYQPGTNLRAWVYLILRNKFYSDARRAWRSTPSIRRSPKRRSSPATIWNASSNWTRCAGGLRS